MSRTAETCGDQQRTVSFASLRRSRGRVTGPREHKDIRLHVEERCKSQSTGVNPANSIIFWMRKDLWRTGSQVVHSAQCIFHPWRGLLKPQRCPGCLQRYPGNKLKTAAWLGLDCRILQGSGNIAQTSSHTACPSRTATIGCCSPAGTLGGQWLHGRSLSGGMPIGRLLSARKSLLGMPRAPVKSVSFPGIDMAQPFERHSLAAVCAWLECCLCLTLCCFQDSHRLCGIILHCNASNIEQ